MSPVLDAAARAEAIAGNLNLLEFTREDARWQRPHTILEVDGVLLFAGTSDFPAYNNGVLRVDDSVPGAEVIARANEFFAARNRGYSVWARDTGEDEDIKTAADAALIGAFGDSPQMICRARLPEQPLPEGVEIRMVEDAAGVADYADVTARAYVSLGSPEDATRSHFNGPTALLAPHVHSAVAYLDGAPVSVAQILLSHGIAGVYWVGSLEATRGRGLAEAVTRHVTNLGFDLGATNVQLQASSMGEPIYTRMGYEELHRREFRLAGPPT
ncbi:MAG: GNAT family N-acetyltransferase [Acidimicrobiia bacterium]